MSIIKKFRLEVYKLRSGNERHELFVKKMREPLEKFRLEERKRYVVSSIFPEDSDESESSQDDLKKRSPKMETT